MKKFELPLEPMGKCACGQNIYINAQVYAVAHDLPYCNEFATMDLVDFLRYVNLSRRTTLSKPGDA